MKHTWKEIVKNNDAILTHVCAGKVYYRINIENTIYQLEVDSMDEEWKSTYLLTKFGALNLMRWIRKGMEDGSFIQLN